MKTTIEVPDELLDAAKRVSPMTSSEEVVIQALTEFARRHDQRKLIRHLGTFSDDFMRDRDIDEYRGGDSAPSADGK